MLENIKSSFFVKVIFSYIFEGKKLKLIKYNKNLQNKIDISLINYKIYSGEYIIYEEYGKGKVYDSYHDVLIFEGNFINGEKNGYGKEYSRDTNKIKFEGEYLNGKRNGSQRI